MRFFEFFTVTAQGQTKPQEATRTGRSWLWGVGTSRPSPSAPRQKFHFPFPLLVDEDQKVAELYHCHGLMVKRTVYLIGPDGVIRFGQRGMPTPREVLAKAG